MTMQQIEEIADHDVAIDDAGKGTAPSADQAKTPGAFPVADAFNAGVNGRPRPPAQEVTEERATTPAAIDLSREASNFLDEARNACAELAALESEDGDRLLEAGDRLLEKIDGLLSKIGATKGELDRAVAEAVAKVAGLPYLDTETRRKVEASARDKARSDVMAARTQELELLADSIAEVAETLEGQLRFEQTFGGDPDLQRALDGARDPREKTSEDYLVARLEGQAPAQIEEALALLRLDGANPDRLRRFENAALRAIDGIASRAEQSISNAPTPERKERAAAAKAEASALRRKIEGAQASRLPKSIAHGEAVVRALKGAWARIAGLDFRPGAGAVTADEMSRIRLDDSRLGRTRASGATWKPASRDWHARHFRR